MIYFKMLLNILAFVGITFPILEYYKTGKIDAYWVYCYWLICIVGIITEFIANLKLL